MSIEAKQVYEWVKTGHWSKRQFIEWAEPHKESSNAANAAATQRSANEHLEPVAWRVRRCDAPKYWTVFHHKPIAAFQDPEQEVQPLYAEPQSTQKNNESIGFYSGRFNGHDLVSLTTDIPIGSNLYTQPKAEQEPLTDELIDAMMPPPDGTAEANVKRVEVLPGVMGTEFEEVDAWSLPLVRQVVRSALKADHGIYAPLKGKA